MRRRGFDWLGYVLGALLCAVIVLVVLLLTSEDDKRTTAQPQPPPGMAPALGPQQYDADNNLSPAEKGEEQAQTSGGVLPGDVPGAEAHEDARDETPPGAPPNAAERIKRAAKNTPTGKKVAPAGAQNYSCRYLPVRNRSYRDPRLIRLFVLHYTVSGFGSINGIRAQFDNPASGTSSTLGLELSSVCQRWMPFDSKPWTQLTFNSVAESIEIVAPYDLPRLTWLQSPIFTKGILASIVRDRLRARGLPLRLVDPVGCPTGSMRGGYTDHNRLECGNSHTDVGRNFPWDVLGRQIRQGTSRPISSRQRLRCKALNRLRVKARPPGRQLSDAERAAGKRYRAGFERYHLRCFPPKGGKPGHIERA